MMITHIVIVTNREITQRTYPFMKAYTFESGIEAMKYIQDECERLKKLGYKIAHRKDTGDYWRVTTKCYGRTITTFFRLQKLED